MPQLGETVTEGTITKWSVAVGDRIAVDDVLFEVSTEKVDTEVPSANEGFVRQVLVAEGDTVPIGAPLAVITATADEAFDAPARVRGGPARTGRRRRTPAKALAANPTASVESAASASGGGTVTALPVRGGSGFLSPVVRRLLDEHGLAADQVVGSGDGGRITARRRPGRRLPGAAGTRGQRAGGGGRRTGGTGPDRAGRHRGA